MSEQKESLPAAILGTLTREGARATYSFGGRAEETLTSRDLARRIAGASVRLRDLKLGSGQVVPLLCPTSADLWTGFVGAMAADLTPANLSLPTFKTHLPTYQRNLEALMDRYETDVVVASVDVRARLSPVMSRHVRWIDIADLRTEAPAGTAPEASSPTAFLQHSSGSTGVPKGVSLTHDAVVAHLRAYAKAIDLAPDRDIVASWLPLYHDMGLLTSFLLPLYQGVSCHSVLPEAFVLDPLGFLREMSRRQATLSWWPNFAFALLADRQGAAPANTASLDLTSIRALVNCSEVVMASSIDRFSNAFVGQGLAESAIRCSYAMAENVFAVTQTGQTPARIEVNAAFLAPGGSPMAPAVGMRRTLVSSGLCLPGVELRIVDESRQPVREGVVGEIAIAGPFLFSEYQRLEAETAARRSESWYFTGDLGLSWQGELYVLGRGTDLIIVGGRKFLPNEVERIAGSVAGVKPGRVVAFGVRAEAKGTEDAVALVESVEAGEPTRCRAIKREIVQSVLQQMDLALSDVLVVGEGSLIKTSSGKIARNDNRDAYIRQRQADVP